MIHFGMETKGNATDTNVTYAYVYDTNGKIQGKRSSDTVCMSVVK